jgi:hypothetical protein
MNLAFTAALGFAVGVIIMTILSEPEFSVRPVIPSCPPGATGQQQMPDGRIFCSYIQGRNSARVVWEELK